MNTRAARWAAIVVVLGMFLALAACGDDDDDGSAAATTTGQATTVAEQEEQPVHGGTLTMAHLSDARHLDATGLTGVNGSTGHGTIGFAIYDMIAYQEAETFEVKLQTAQSLTTENGLVWRLVLKPNIKFSDGTPYDAEAVKFNIERHKDPAQRSAGKSAADLVASMRVVDPLTLEFTLTAPHFQFDRALASPLAWVGSPTAIRAKGDQFGLSPVGAGPFVVREYVQGSRLVLERNPDYWNRPRPYLDRLVMTPIPDETQRYNTFDAGQADISGTVNPATLKLGRDAGHTATIWYSNGGRIMHMNQSRPPFDDIRVREALAVGIDLEEFNRTYEGERPTHIFGETSPFHEPDLRLPTYDPERARRLFAEYVAEKGPIKIRVFGAQATRVDAEWLQAHLTRYPNVEVSVHVIDSSQTPLVGASGDFELQGTGLVVGDPEPIFTRAFDSKSSFNHTRFFNPEMDAAIAASRATRDVAARKAALRKAQQLLIENYVLIFTQKFPLVYLVQDHVGYASFDENIPKPDELWRKP